MVLSLKSRVLHKAASNTFGYKLGQGKRANHVTATAGTGGVMSVLVQPEWVSERLGARNIRILDATWYLPVWGKQAVPDFKKDRIPSSMFFDIDGISDPSAGLPHMLPTDKGFSAALDALGIDMDTTVVLYDRIGLYSAPRAWWTFRAFGHRNVVILEGGLPGWQAKNFPLESCSVSDDSILAATKACRNPPEQTHYVVNLDKGQVRDLQQMLENVTTLKEQMIDARDKGRFTATAPEPRPGLRGGHIPGAHCLPWTDVLTPDKATLKPAAELQQAYVDAGVDISKPLVASCGSGLTAAILALGVYTLTGKLIPIYDGSWMEWGARQDTPISTDP